MWVCQYQTFPGVLFSTSSDQTGLFPGLVCKRLDAPLPGGSLSQWFSFNKILRLVEELPF
jgi:hypothetical protein